MVNSPTRRRLRARRAGAESGLAAQALPVEHHALRLLKAERRMRAVRGGIVEENVGAKLGAPKAASPIFDRLAELPGDAPEPPFKAYIEPLDKRDRRGFAAIDVVEAEAGLDEADRTSVAAAGKEGCHLALPLQLVHHLRPVLL